MRNLDVVPNTPGVYLLRNLLSGKVYIGSSVEMYDRVIDHIWELTRQTHHNAHLRAAWLKYGPLSFEVEILEQCDADDRPGLRAAEERWIAVYRAADRRYGYNLYATTVTPTDRVSDETRARMSTAAAQRMQDPSRRYQIANWIKENGQSAEMRAKNSQAHTGRQQSAEHKAARAAARRGKSLSEAHRANISKARLQLPDEVRGAVGRANRGRQHTAEARANMGASHIGTKRSEETKAKMSAARAAWWARKKAESS